jgi:hypothetical protein
VHVEIHVAFAERVVAQVAFVVYSNLENAVHNLSIQERERLIEDDVCAASLQQN